MGIIPRIILRTDISLTLIKEIALIQIHGIIRVIICKRAKSIKHLRISSVRASIRVGIRVRIRDENRVHSCDIGGVFSGILRRGYILHLYNITIYITRINITHVYRTRVDFIIIPRDIRHSQLIRNTRVIRSARVGDSARVSGIVV